MKKLFLSIIALCLCACICVNSCYASTTHGGGGGSTGPYRTWSDEDKLQFWRLKAYRIISSIVGLGTEEGEQIYIKRLMMNYPEYDTDGCSDFYEYLVKNIDTDEKGDNWVLSSQMINLCNATYNSIKEESYDSATFTYRYAIPVNNIDPDSFSKKFLYDKFCRLLMDNPNYLFWVNNYNSTWIWIAAIPVLDCVNANFDLLEAPCEFYNSDWSPLNGAIQIALKTDGSGWQSYDDYSGWSSTFSADHVDVSQYNPTGTALFNYRPSLNRFQLANYSDPFGQVEYSGYSVHLYTGGNGAVKCWKSLSDLKSGTAVQYPLSGVKPTPDETKPIPDDLKPNTPPSKDPNNGGGGGSDDDSDSGWGLPTLIKGIKELFSAIAEVLGAIISGISSLITTIVNALKDLTELINHDVLDFIKEIFSFLPEDFIKAIVGVITLGLLFAVIKIIRG